MFSHRRLAHPHAVCIEQRGGSYVRANGTLTTRVISAASHTLQHATLPPTVPKPGCLSKAVGRAARRAAVRVAITQTARLLVTPHTSRLTPPQPPCKGWHWHPEVHNPFQEGGIDAHATTERPSTSRIGNADALPPLSRLSGVACSTPPVNIRDDIPPARSPRTRSGQRGAWVVTHALGHAQRGGWEATDRAHRFSFDTDGNLFHLNQGE